MIIAHRGASAYAPENTVASVKLGWEIGGDAVEVDVQFSLDQNIVVIHDDDTERTSGEKIVVREATLGQLKTLDFGRWKGEKYKGERIPTLSEIVALVPRGKKLFVEIKSDLSLVPILEREFKDNPKLDHLFFMAFDYETITAVKKLFPQNKAYWLCSDLPENPQAVLEKVKHAGLDGLDVDYSLITRKLMSMANELDLEILCWTVNDPKKARELSTLGVSGITTDIPDQILTAVRN